jgi:hypothetical protein
MKVRMTLKDPDTMHDAVDEAVKRLPVPDGVSPEEFESIREERADSARSAITDLWMPWGEYLVVEFDTDAKTATVRPASEFR